MKKEKINIRVKEISLKLQASKINSIRVKDIEKCAVRVYKDGKIGISGAVGALNEETLTQQAIDNLSSNISYPYDLESNKKDHRNYKVFHYGEKGLMDVTENILNQLKSEFDDFIFGESVKTIEIDQSFQNSEGLDLRYQDEYFHLGLVVKAKSSPNLFDTFLGFQGRQIDQEKFLAFAKHQLTAERNLLELPENEKVPVFFLDYSTMGYFMTRQLNGETYGNKASLFDNKIGQKLFHEKVNIRQNKDPKTSYSKFYDAEGVTKENDSVVLIENGVLKRVFTDKRNAKKFNLEHTGSSTGAYDDIPNLEYNLFQIDIDSLDMKRSINGQKAIFVMVSAGGDFSADGNYATPVQASYLFDGEKLIGKLPDFNMTNNLYDMLGKDYIGTFDSENLYFGDYDHIFACYMNIKK